MSVCLCVRPVICLFHSASLLVFLCCLLPTFGLDPSRVSSAMPRRDQRLRKGSRHRKNLDGRRVCRSFAAQQATFDLLCCCSRSVPSTYSSPARPPIEAFRGVREDVCWKELGVGTGLNICRLRSRLGYKRRYIFRSMLGFFSTEPKRNWK